IYIFLSILFFYGCGTRKRDAKISAEYKNIERTEKKDISSNIITETKADRTIYKPIDPLEEMVLPDGRKSKNAVITDEKISTSKDVGVVDKGEIKENIEQKTKDKAVHVETERPNPWLWAAIAVV